ncbi:MAG: nicotinamide mononucleotide transporter [Lentisphaeria bacterium]|nr:nicotinamide mononucleotide transporter [Lentisphaeria bacterium]
MLNIISWLRRESAGWTPAETIYMLTCTAAITVISIRLGDDLMGIISAVTGTLYTMFAGKGKISCYFFGIINTVLYGYIAQKATLYGDMMLNWFIYLPMMFTGLIMWRSKRDDQGCVCKTVLSRNSRILWLLVTAAGIAGYAFILTRMGDKQPVVDAATTVLSVTAMLLTLKRCVEQWLLWIAVNTLSVAMWLKVYLTSGNSIATLLWWIIMLITGIVFFIQWCMALQKSSSNNSAEQIK